MSALIKLVTKAIRTYHRTGLYDHTVAYTTVITDSHVWVYDAITAYFGIFADTDTRIDSRAIPNCSVIANIGARVDRHIGRYSHAGTHTGSIHYPLRAKRLGIKQRKEFTKCQRRIINNHLCLIDSDQLILYEHGGGITGKELIQWAITFIERYIPLCCLRYACNPGNLPMDILCIAIPEPASKEAGYLS
ncbi:hypothetical protein MBAV_004314 [Candidatus Magnetobacterium bavaricum]|uniref:Uncharacterized protein n=1 Tax=Candidatus Magnetobacterium bavaricum TaxID=29290 RepID=A0A0F3GS26_9BACT|nr:hypothetical protein MBAV_004314 [Candidatus Magnetobacterium bavaricum]